MAVQKQPKSLSASYSAPSGGKEELLRSTTQSLPTIPPLDSKSYIVILWRSVALYATPSYCC